MTKLRMKLVFAAALLVFTAGGAADVTVDAARSDASFPVRMVKLAGDPGRPETMAHVKYCRKLGFNALWVYSGEAGVWSKERAPRGPLLDPNFLRLARWCRSHGMDVWISVNPVADTGERFVFSEPDDERRLTAFLTLLREKAGVTRFVLSFDDQPRELQELSDVFRYGAGAGPAHLDLVGRVAASLPGGTALWFCGSAYCDTHLGDGSGPYAKAFLAGLPALPPSVGIVWTGPTVVSPSISRAELAATRARLGGRKLLLYDNFPGNENDHDDAIALILGALRNRESGIRDEIAAYLACPAWPLGGSRLSLSTIAAFLSAPGSYDPEAAARAAVAALAGRDPAALDALTTQQLEWGGFVGGRNYWPGDLLNPELAANRLHDPAFVESFTWTVSRYPGRMAALARVADAPFRVDLLRMMNRRLAIARAIPLTVEYVARRRAARPDAAETLLLIDDERHRWDANPDARRTLERFLVAAGIPSAEQTP